MDGQLSEEFPGLYCDGHRIIPSAVRDTKTQQTRNRAFSLVLFTCKLILKMANIYS